MTATTVNGAAETAVAEEPGAAASGSIKAARKLRERIEAKEAVIGVVGLGYVGLPLAVEYADAGFDCRGFDVNEAVVGGLNEGRNHIQDVDDAALTAVVENGHFSAASSYADAGEVDIFYICVPTPVTPHKDPDTGYIEEAALSIAEHLRPGQLIILKSTTYPNTTEGLVQPILEQAAAERDMLLGRDYFLAFSPERIDPGNEQFTTANTPVVVGGVTPACTRLASLAMKQVVEMIHEVSSPRVGEMEKLLENIFRSVNIALVNELARLCDRMGGVSMWEVVEAAATKPFGFMPFKPGPGLGGHCIPIDPYYLSWMARKHDFETNFITLSARVNEEMPFYVVDGVIRAVAGQEVRLDEAKVLLLGAAFKRDVNDTRHSTTFRIFEMLWDKGMRNVKYSDPHVPELSVPTQRHGVIELESVDTSEETLKEHDVVVLVTDHSAFPYAQIAEQAKAIVDTRNAFAHIPHDREKIMLLGGGDF